MNHEVDLSQLNRGERVTVLKFLGRAVNFTLEPFLGLFKTAQAFQIAGGEILSNISTSDKNILPVVTTKDLYATLTHG